jgi:glycosyltransferase involved in cell wall biosynthesis
VNVLLVHSFWHPRGGDTTATAIQRQVLLERGHTVVPFGTRHPDNQPEPGDAAWPGWVPPTELARIWSAHAARALTRVLTTAREHGTSFDVAHVHHLHRHLTPSILPVLRAAGTPVVWTLHDYELTCPTANHYRAGKPCFECARSMLPALVHACTRIPDRSGALGMLDAAGLVAEKLVHRARGSARLVSAFLAPSQYLATRIRHALPGARIEHLPNPVVTPALQNRPRSGVLFAGRLVEEKGVLDVLEMAQGLPDVQFTLLGEGPLHRTIRSVNLANVSAPGAMPRAAVADALRSAAAVVVPSRWPENDPYAVTEAQAAGAVVFASDIGGIPEQIRSWEDGVLCPPAQPRAWIPALRSLLATPDRAHDIGVQAHRRIQTERDPTACAISLEQLYRSLC